MKRNLIRLINWVKYDKPQQIRSSRTYQGLSFFSLKALLQFPSHRFRKFVLRRKGAFVGKSVAMYAGLEVRAPSKLSIADGTSIGHGCVLDARSGLEIGENVNISSDVMIWSLSHDYNTANFALKGDKVIIGDYVWIGPRAIILPSVSVGKYAVVAAGSVVTKDVSAYALVGGIPAKKLRERDASVAYNYRPGGRYSRFC